MLFEGLSVGDLFPETKEIVTFDLNTTVSKFLDKLETKGILSAPIVDNKNNIVGILDILDIALFVVGLYPKDLPTDNLSEDELRKVLATGGKFESTLLSSVLELSNEVKRSYDHVFIVQKSTSVMKLLEMFYSGVHRVLVLEEENSVAINVVTQSDLMNLLAQCLPFLEEETKKKTVRQLSLDTKNLVTVTADTKAFTAICRMQYHVQKPFLSAIPIVDCSGHLLANFSASNLKGLRQTTFMSLLLPIFVYLIMQTETNEFKRNLTRFKSIHPVVCDPSTTFESVVERMVAHKVHRLWVVEDEKPIGVISIGDLFKVFLPWTSQ